MVLKPYLRYKLGINVLHCTLYSSVYFLVFLKLSDFRAVEFFIRDKYEKKKYYDKNAINITSVSKKFSSEFLFNIFMCKLGRHTY